MDFGGLGNIGEMKKMFDKYKELQKELKKMVIRSREGGVLIDLTAEMKIKDVKIEDDELLSVARKEDLENGIKAAFEKAQTKAQEVAMTKTKDVLGFDPSDMMGMLGGGGGGGFNIPGLAA